MTVIRDLGDGLVLRHARRADADALCTFNADVHRDYGAPEPDLWIERWTRNLAERPHPTFRVEDFTIVEDMRSGAIVSTLNLISQTWSYAGIPFGVGRIELVGTNPDYRRRGLVRRQFEVVHGWSAERGELVQGITGISWYYRQFGYEYALELDGGRTAAAGDLPEPVAEADEPYRVRPATEADVPFILQVDDHARRRYLVSAVRDLALWRYELEGRGEDFRDALRVVESAAGEPVGYLVHRPSLLGNALSVSAYELREGVSWPAVTPSVLRYLRATGGEYESRPGAGRCLRVNFRLHGGHPVYQAAASQLLREIDPYAWYIRVPDLPRFIRHIAPVLEARLAASPAAGYSGELKLCFFRNGLRLVWEAGRLAAAEPWPEAHWDTCGAAFPELTFLQLLFGYRSLVELGYAFADCAARNDDARLLLNVLFPKQGSFVRPIE